MACAGSGAARITASARSAATSSRPTMSATTAPTTAITSPIRSRLRSIGIIPSPPTVGLGLLPAAATSSASEADTHAPASSLWREARVLDNLLGHLALLADEGRELAERRSRRLDRALDEHA